MTVLVTGAKGFVGQSITGTDIVPFDGDISNINDIRASLETVRPDGVVHLAGVASPGVAAREGGLAWAVNVLGTFNLAQAMLEIVPKARLVFAGSSEVYGESFRDGPVDESAPLRPLSRYGATKAAAELMLKQMARDGLRVTCFRPFNHTGFRQSPDYVIPAFARQIARIEKGLQPPVMHTGNLNVVRDILDVEDVVRAYLGVARGGSLSEGESVNLASGRPQALRALLQHMLDQSDIAIELRTDPALLRPNEVPVVAGNISKAKALLDWEPLIPIERTLDKILMHWRSVVLE